MQVSSFVKKIATYFNRRGLSRVIGIFFEGGSKNADLFILDVVVESFKYPLKKLSFSIIVHRYDSIPVISNFLKTFQFCQVYKSKHIFFEAATSKTNRTVQEFRSNTAVCSNTCPNLFDISFILFAEDGDRVDGADSLSEEAVVDKFG